MACSVMSLLVLRSSYNSERLSVLHYTSYKRTSRVMLTIATEHCSCVTCMQAGEHFPCLYEKIMEGYNSNGWETTWVIMFGRSA